VDQYYAPNIHEVANPSQTMCQLCGILVNNIRLHELGWHPKETKVNFHTARKKKLSIAKASRKENKGKEETDDEDEEEKETGLLDADVKLER
jgi:hypothetical protein